MSHSRFSPRQPFLSIHWIAAQRGRPASASCSCSAQQSPERPLDISGGATLTIDIRAGLHSTSPATCPCTTLARSEPRPVFCSICRHGQGRRQQLFSSLTPNWGVLEIQAGLDKLNNSASLPQVPPSEINAGRHQDETITLPGLPGGHWILRGKRKPSAWRYPLTW